MQRLVRTDWANGVMPRELSKLPDYVESIVHQDFMHGLSYRHVPVAGRRVCSHRQLKKQQAILCGPVSGRRSRHHGRVKMPQQATGVVTSLNDTDEDDTGPGAPQAQAAYPAPYRGLQLAPHPMDNYYIYHNQIEQFKTDLKLALMHLVREYLRLEEERRKQTGTVNEPATCDRRLHDEETESDSDDVDSEDMYSDVLSATTTSITD